MCPVTSEPRTRRSRIIVGMSGGVDSSVAALLLARRGCAVEGLFMKNWEDDDDAGYCAAAADLADVRAVCERLEIALHKANFARAYREQVFRRFLEEHAANRTPNPDVLCNREIKFKRFLHHAVALGAERIATGHYARVVQHAGRYRLLKALDPDKDQTYFLYTLGQHELSRSLFPVGELRKAQVRRIAADAGLPNHAKKDSTGICFIGERPFADFLGRYLAAPAGEIRTPAGAIVGTHCGLVFYTLGQRHGLNIGGQRGGSGAPWYVAEKDPVHNRLIVVQGDGHPLLYSHALEADELHWVAGVAPVMPLRCRAKIRYRQQEQDCRVQPLADGRCRVDFDEPQRAVTPGQSVVFYLGDDCLGGGVIQRAIRAHAGAR